MGGTGGAAIAGGTGSRLTARAGRTADPPRAGLLDVELWLVHKVASGDESVLQQQLRTTRGGATFAFPPVMVRTVAGASATVQVTGMFRVTASPDGGERLVFLTNRTLRQATGD